jgi:uncharacterized protein YeaO (DUF488 family)
VIRTKRAYEPPLKADGFRILVERLWPRGLRKEDAAIDLWMKEISPSPELRKWYAHDVERWPEFKRRYEAELRANGEAVQRLLAICERHPTTTFVYAAHDEQHNSAILLRAFMDRRMRKTPA